MVVQSRGGFIPGPASRPGRAAESAPRARGEGAAARRHAREREEDGAHGRTRTCDLRFRRRTAAIPRGCRESHSSLVNHAQVQGLCEPPFRSGERPSHSNMACHRPSPRTLRVHFQHANGRPLTRAAAALGLLGGFGDHSTDRERMEAGAVPGGAAYTLGCTGSQDAQSGPRTTRGAHCGYG